MKALITTKLGMTTTIGDDGLVQAVTLLKVDDNVITQVKTSETDGYEAIQVGAKNKKSLKKPQAGHVKNLKSMPAIYKEFRIKSDDGTEGLAIGQRLNCEVFLVGDTVDVTANSKGKGFAGTIKRHNFHRGRKTHGGRSYRRPGSIGSMYPQKIFKGKKMSGQMGGTRVTVKNLKVALIEPEKQIIGVSGAVPGPKKAIVVLQGVSA